MKTLYDLYEELAEYTGRDLTLVTERCKGANIEQAWRWDELYKDDPLKGYREDDLYIFDLTHYQMRLREGGIHSWFGRVVRKHGWKKGLDFGGGIGENTIIAMNEGADMTFVDVRDGKTLEYAEWRFNEHGVNPKIRYEDFIIKEDFDFIVAMDVFEHLEDPEPMIKAVIEHTEWLFCNPDQVRFNWLYPQHISEFDITDHFEHVELYLWKRK